MAWLGDWAKRIEITVSNTNIDSNLTHFPLMLKLGSSVGTNNDDVTAIFDELTSDANRKKIAVTKDDGETQIYVEIEKWDDANETAFLWVSKSDLTLSSSGATTLYIYYDSSQSDNTTYVGDVNSTPGASVWDSNFVCVYHLSEASGTVYDSTSNSHDSTSENNIVYGVTGKVGDCFDLEKDNSAGFRVPDHADLDLTTTGTLEYWFKLESTGAWQNFLLKEGAYSVRPSPSDVLHLYENGSDYSNLADTNSLSTGIWYYAVGKFDNGNWSVQLSDNSPTTAGGKGNMSTSSYVLNVGYKSSENPDGLVDEVRISNIARSDAWIKANYHAVTDNLVSYGSEENKPVTGQFMSLNTKYW